MNNMIDIATLLAAIAMIETGVDDAALGRHGERSRYQITKRVWSEHTREPFRRASESPALSAAVARQHIRDCIVPFLKRHELPVTVEAVGACWNAGCTGYLRGAGWSYGIRLANVYQRAKQEKWATSSQK